MAPLSVSVIVPTYKRPQSLRACLDGLKNQTIKPAQVIVVHRAGEAATEAMLAAYDGAGLNLLIRASAEAGVIAALNIGLDNATGDIVAMTDDDAIPHADWIERIAAIFAADYRVGGVGGRDHIHYPGAPDPWPTTPHVGFTRWYGRIEGNFHCGEGPARAVQSLKGVNMAFRRAAIGTLRFDTRLLGQGAQVANEHMFAGTIRQAGWILIYDPAIGVEHNAAPRHDSQDRNQIDNNATYFEVHNLMLCYLACHKRREAIAVALYQALIGARYTPGLATALYYTLRGMKQRFLGWREALRGLAGAWRTWRSTQGQSVAERKAAPFQQRHR